MAPDRTGSRCTRGTVAWYLFGLLAVQAALGLYIERSAVRLRDPIYADRLARLQRCRRAQPDRPLVVVLGSSRSLMGLDAGRVSAAPGAPLVFNFSELAAGPMLEQVFLRRLLADGVRPDLVVLEVVPLHLATGIGVSGEEVGLSLARLSWSEMNGVAGHYRFPLLTRGRWLLYRGLGGFSSRADLHNALRIDCPAGSEDSGGDPHGFFAYPRPSEETRLIGIRDHLRRFGPKLARARLAAGPAAAVRDLIGLCRRERLPFVVTFMPECSGLREQHTPAFRAALEGLLAELQAEGAFELIDARTWVPDEGFWDCHHLHTDGARIFTDRFLQEGLPRLGSRLAAGTQAAR